MERNLAISAHVNSVSVTLLRFQMMVYCGYPEMFSSA